MLKKVIINNFFSFQGTAEISLTSGVNLLLGINGSGKTSFMNALRLLYEGVAGVGVEKLISSWNGYKNVVNANGDNEPECIKLTYIFDYTQLKRMNQLSPFNKDVAYTITIFPFGETSYTLCESLYLNTKGKGVTYISFRNGEGKITQREEDGTIAEVTDFKHKDISPRELVLRQITDPQRYLPSHIIRKAVESMALYSTFDMKPIRRPSDYDSSLRLIRSGVNLPHLLNNMKNNFSLDYERLEAKMKEVNPHYKSLGFNVLGSQLYLSLREDNIKHTIEAMHMSHGTMRFLLLLSIFCNPNRGNLVCFDEPETGLHPDMIRTLSEMIKEAAKRSQIIIATHSPLLLNQFTLQDILVFEKNRDNHSSVKRHSESEFEDWDQAYLPGQMWLYGVLGGKRW